MWGFVPTRPFARPPGKRGILRQTQDRLLVSAKVLKTISVRTAKIIHSRSSSVFYRDRFPLAMFLPSLPMTQRRDVLPIV